MWRLQQLAVQCFASELPPLFLTLDHVMLWGASRDREKAMHKAPADAPLVQCTSYNVECQAMIVDVAWSRGFSGR